MSIFSRERSRIVPEPLEQPNLPKPNLPKEMVLYRITDEEDLRKMFDMVGQSLMSVRYFKNNYPEEHLLINNEVDKRLLNGHIRNGNYITYPEKDIMKIENKNTYEKQDLHYTNGMILSYIIRGVIQGIPSILLIHSKYEDEDVYNRLEHPKQDGGKAYIIYNKRKYKVCTGIRGGKYIVVGKDKKKIYI